MAGSSDKISSPYRSNASCLVPVARRSSRLPLCAFADYQSKTSVIWPGISVSPHWHVRLCQPQGLTFMGKLETAEGCISGHQAGRRAITGLHDGQPGDGQPAHEPGHLRRGGAMADEALALHCKSSLREGMADGNPAPRNRARTVVREQHSSCHTSCFGFGG